MIVYDDAAARGREKTDRGFDKKKDKASRGSGHPPPSCSRQKREK